MWEVLGEPLEVPSWRHDGCWGPGNPRSLGLAGGAGPKGQPERAPGCSRSLCSGAGAIGREGGEAGRDPVWARAEPISQWRSEGSQEADPKAEELFWGLGGVGGTDLGEHLPSMAAGPCPCLLPDSTQAQGPCLCPEGSGDWVAPALLTDAPWAVSTGSLGDMEAREEATAPDSSLTEQEATAPELQASGEPRPPSPPSTGEMAVPPRPLGRPLGRPESPQPDDGCVWPSHTGSAEASQAGEGLGGQERTRAHSEHVSSGPALVLQVGRLTQAWESHVPSQPQFTPVTWGLGGPWGLLQGGSPSALLSLSTQHLLLTHYIPLTEEGMRPREVKRLVWGHTAHILHVGL